MTFVLNRFAVMKAAVVALLLCIVVLFDMFAYLVEYPSWVAGIEQDCPKTFDSKNFSENFLNEHNAIKDALSFSKKYYGIEYPKYEEFYEICATSSEWYVVEALGFSLPPALKNTKIRPHTIALITIGLNFLALLLGEVVLIYTLGRIRVQSEGFFRISIVFVVGTSVVMLMLPAYALFATNIARAVMSSALILLAFYLMYSVVAWVQKGFKSN